VVFCAHHAVADALLRGLTDHGRRAAVIDGRVKPQTRAAFVKSFQRGDLEVLICGMNAAGEGITLHRADTVIFVELDWVPAAMQQAEARIHRVGQTAETCWTHYLLVSDESLPGGNLDSLMWSKLAQKVILANAVLGEDTSLVTDATGASENVRKSVIRRLLKR